MIAAVWDVHHLWAGIPLFSDHMQMTPIYSPYFPTFPEFPELLAPFWNIIAL